MTLINKRSIYSFLVCSHAFVFQSMSLADITQGGDYDDWNIGITGSGWTVIDDGFSWASNGSWTLGRDATGHGTLTVKDVGTSYSKRISSVGYSGTGVIHVQGGASLSTLSQPVVLGRNHGASGSVFVDGAGSEFVVGSGLNVGVDGVGSVFVSDGGSLRTNGGGSVSISTTDPKKHSEVIVSGGELFSGRSVSIGGSGVGDGSGLLRVCNGGNVVAGSATYQVYVYDLLEIKDPSSRFNCETLNISTFGEQNVSAQCSVRSEASVSVAGSLIVETYDYEDSFDKYSELIIEGDNSLVVVGTDLRAATSGNAAEIGDVARIYVNDGAQLAVNGNIRLLRGSGLVCSDAIVSTGGDFVFQSSPGIVNPPYLAVTIEHGEESVVQVDGDLVFTNPGAYLSLPHNADLFVQAGDRFPLVDIGGEIIANGAGGTLDRFTNYAEGDLVDTYNGVDLYITYAGGDGNDIELYTLEETCPADVNNDSQIDFLDISAFLSAFTAEEPLADMNEDGAYDFLDISFFLSSFASGCP